MSMESSSHIHMSPTSPEAPLTPEVLDALDVVVPDGFLGGPSGLSLLPCI